MGDYSVLDTLDYQVGQAKMWKNCNYMFKCEGDSQRFVVTQATTDLHTWHLKLMNGLRFEVKDNWRPPVTVSNARVIQMVNAVARRGADELNNRPPPTGQSASQLPGGEPQTEVFQVTSLVRCHCSICSFNDAMLVVNATVIFQQRLKNERGEDANAAIVEIDKVRDDSTYPNQLPMFQSYMPEQL